MYGMFSHKQLGSQEAREKLRNDKIAAIRLRLFGLEQFDLDKLSMCERIYGIKSELVTVDTSKCFTRLVSVISGADGELSPAEIEYSQNRFKSLDPQKIFSEEYMGQVMIFFQDYVVGKKYQNDSLEAIIKDGKKALAEIQIPVSVDLILRSALYDAILAARADGKYSNEEKEAVVKAAKLLNVDDETFNYMQQLAKLETAANNIEVSSKHLLEGPKLDEAIEKLAEKIFAQHPRAAFA